MEQKTEYRRQMTEDSGRTLQGFLVLLFAMAFLLLLFPRPSAAETAGKLSFVEGEVFALRTGQTQVVSANTGDNVSIGDILQTKSSGRAKIAFIDDTMMTVGPKSRLMIEHYMYDPGRSLRTASLKLLRGIMNFVIPKMKSAKEGKEYLLKVGTAVAGIRGTEGFLVSDGADRVYIKEGAVEFSNDLGSVVVNAGRVGVSVPGQPPTEMAFSEGEYRILEQNLAPLSGERRSRIDTPRFAAPPAPEKPSSLQDALDLIARDEATRALTVPPLTINDVTGFT